MLLYQLILHLALLFFIPKMLWERWRTGKYRHLGLRLGIKYPKVRKEKKRLIWIHAVSVGETKAVAPLAKRLVGPNTQLVVSSCTETGHLEARRSIPDADHHLFLPIDLIWIIRPILQRAQPDLVILSETDLWYAFLSEAKRLGAKIGVVSGKMSDRTCARMQRMLPFSRRLLGLVDLICTQNSSYSEAFIACGADPQTVQVCGNLKFDFDIPPVRPLEKVSGRPVITIGSTHNPEEEQLLTVLRPLWEKHPQMQLLLVPRHPERFDRVEAQLQLSGLRFGRLSEGITGEEQVILVDTMGRLRDCYAQSQLAIVAGSFALHVGGHNILEPLDYGVPVLFGPHLFSQEELRHLVLEAELGMQCSLDQLPAKIEHWLQVDQKEFLQKSERFTQSLRGSTERTLECLHKITGACYL